MKEEQAKEIIKDLSEAERWKLMNYLILQHEGVFQDNCGDSWKCFVDDKGAVRVS